MTLAFLLDKSLYQGKEDLNDVRIEQRAGVILDIFFDLGLHPLWPIYLLRIQRIPGIHHREYTRQQWDLLIF